MSQKKRGYPSDVSDEEWEFCLPYLTLMREDAPQRDHRLRELFNALRWMIRAGCPWRMFPTNFPPWKAVYDQAQRWIRAGVFEAMAHDLRTILRVVGERRACWLRRIQAAQRLQSSHRGGHVGLSAGDQSHGRE